MSLQRRLGCFARAWLVLILVLGLTAACTTVTPTSIEAPWIQGRLQVRISATTTTAAFNQTVAFELRGSSSQGELRLNSPLGTRVASARWAPDGVVLRRVDTPGEQQFSSLDELSRQLLGEALPLAALPDWLMGRPWPAAPHQALASITTPDPGFEQLGWSVLLARRAQGWIEARRDATQPAVLLRVKLDDPS